MAKGPSPAASVRPAVWAYDSFDSYGANRARFSENVKFCVDKGA